METNRLVVSPVLFVNGRVSHLQPIMGFLASHFLLTIFHILVKIIMTFNFNIFFFILRELLYWISYELCNPIWCQTSMIRWFEESCDDVHVQLISVEYSVVSRNCNPEWHRSTLIVEFLQHKVMCCWQSAVQWAPEKKKLNNHDYLTKSFRSRLMEGAASYDILFGWPTWPKALFKSPLSPKKHPPPKSRPGYGPDSLCSMIHCAQWYTMRHDSQ